ncbi:LysR substrate-binding domain-containing protein [Thiolapillus sp.]
MSDIKRLTVFVHTVEAGSFSGAAKRLGIARSAVSRHIAALEKEHGVRLLNRTTRHLSLTDAGRIFYESSIRILAEAEAVTHRIQQLREKPTGTLKVAGPTSFGRQLAALVHEFQQLHPALTIELQLDDRVVNMVEEGIDVSIRIGWLEDSRLIARHICDASRILCASPAYLEHRGQPEKPSQLIEHDCIIFTLLPTPHQWQFFRNKQRESIQIRGQILTNSIIAMHSLALSGAGIAPISRFLVNEDLKNGRLKQLLPEYDCGCAGIYAVYQDKRYKQAKVRLFIDFIQKRIQHLLRE